MHYTKQSQAYVEPSPHYSGPVLNVRQGERAMLFVVGVMLIEEEIV